jgi:hypothetical protein
MTKIEINCLIKSKIIAVMSSKDYMVVDNAAPGTSPGGASKEGAKEGGKPKGGKGAEKGGKPKGGKGGEKGGKPKGGKPKGGKGAQKALLEAIASLPTDLLTESFGRKLFVVLFKFYESLKTTGESALPTLPFFEADAEKLSDEEKAVRILLDTLLRGLSSRSFNKKMKDEKSNADFWTRKEAKLRDLIVALSKLPTPQPRSIADFVDDLLTKVQDIPVPEVEAERDYSRVMAVIPVSGAYLKTLFPDELADSIFADRVYHITWDYSGASLKDCVSRKVSVLGFGQSADKKFQWLRVSVGGRLRRPQGGEYHITLTAPVGEAGLVGSMVEEHTTAFESPVPLDFLMTFLVNKKKMTDGLTKDHLVVCTDMDSTIISNNTDVLPKNPDGTLSYDGAKSLINDAEFARDHTTLTPLGVMLGKQFPTINVVTTRMMHRDYPAYNAIKVQSAIQKHFDEHFGEGVVTLNISFRTDKCWTSEEKALNKAKRVHKMCDGAPGVTWFFDDDVDVVDAMKKNGVYPVHTTSTEQIALEVHEPVATKPPIVVGLRASIGCGKSTMLADLADRLRERGYSVRILATDEAPSNVKAYSWIGREIALEIARGGVDYILVDTTFSSGDPPKEWKCHVFNVDFGNHPMAALAITLFRAVLRQGHANMDFTRLDELRQFYPQQEEVQEGPDSLPADMLVNSMSLENLIAYLESHPNHHRVSCTLHHNRKRVRVRNQGDLRVGTLMTIVYANPGAKNFRKAWGLEMRSRGWVWTGRDWVAFKHAFPVGPEAATTTSAQSLCEDGSRMPRFSPEQQALIRAIQDASVGNVAEKTVLTFKVDGQFFQLFVVRGEEAAILREVVRQSGCPFAAWILSLVSDEEVFVGICTNGTPILLTNPDNDKDPGRTMYTNWITGCAAMRGFDEDTVPKNLETAFKQFSLPFLEKVLDFALTKLEDANVTGVSVNFEVLVPERRNFWDPKVVMTELAASATMHQAGVYVTAVNTRTNKWRMEPPTEHEALRYGFKVPGSIEVTLSEVKRVLADFELILTAKSRDEYEVMSSDFLRKYGLPPTTPLHPEGFVLYALVSDVWWYLKVKTSLYYLSHQDITRPGVFSKLLEQPLYMRLFFPNIAKAYAIRQILEERLPGLRRTLVSNAQRLFEDARAGVVEGASYEHYRSGESEKLLNNPFFPSDATYEKLHVGGKKKGANFDKFFASSVKALQSPDMTWQVMLRRLKVVVLHYFLKSMHLDMDGFVPVTDETIRDFESMIHLLLTQEVNNNALFELASRLIR